MKIRESCLQTGNFIYKPGISLTKQDFHLQRGILGLQRGFSGYYLPNVTNANAKVLVGDVTMSIDSILIKMAQLNRRKTVLDVMRKRLPKSREEQRSYMSRNSVPEYRYINYDLELVKNEYELVSKSIMEMQMALDKYNQTVQFEVDI